MTRSVNIVAPHPVQPWSTSTGVGCAAMQRLCFSEAKRHSCFNSDTYFGCRYSTDRHEIMNQIEQDEHQCDHYRSAYQSILIHDNDHHCTYSEHGMAE